MSTQNRTSDRSLHNHARWSYKTPGGRRYCSDCGNTDCPNASGDPYWRRCPAAVGMGPQVTAHWDEGHQQRLQGALQALAAVLCLVAAADLESRALRRVDDALEANADHDPEARADALGDIANLVHGQELAVAAYGRALGLSEDEAHALSLGGEHE